MGQGSVLNVLVTYYFYCVTCKMACVKIVITLTFHDGVVRDVTHSLIEQGFLNI